MKADVAFQENQIEDALALYRQALAAEPNNAHVRSRISMIEGIQGPRPAAVQAAARVTPGGKSAEPTAVGKRGGATPATQNMPLDFASLAEMRKQFAGQPELRGCWITRMEWTDVNPQQMRNNIVRFMDMAQQAGLNAVFFQVRGEAATLYPSTIEPWSRLVGGRDPGFDPLKLAIDEAHKRGLEFHAYFNPCPCSDEARGPADPNHLFWKHCTAQANPNWLVYSNGKPAPYKEYWWLNPNLPEVQTYIRTAVVDLVSRYDIDGLHYDRIRFPSGETSSDPWSKARFGGDGNPMQLSYDAWQCDNITRMLTDIYASVMAMKPRVNVSASVWGIYDKTKLPQGGQMDGYSWTSSGLQDYHQDSIAWTQKGCVDSLVPMIYWNMGANKPDYDELLAWFLQHVGNGRHVYGGMAVFNEVEFLREVTAGNVLRAHGYTPFTLKKLSDLGYLNTVKTSVNPTPVKTIPMPWKTRPTTGYILVTVKNAAGQPVMDAHVKMAGRPDVWLSSADGFCGIVDAQPGSSVTLTAEKKGMGMGTSRPFAVEAGKASEANIVLQ